MDDWIIDSFTANQEEIERLKRDPEAWEALKKAAREARKRG